MKRFSVPCQFGARRAPFNIYIGYPADGFHPLHFQHAWLQEERGGFIPPDVRESFAKLLTIARENNVNFEDLCVYAMGAAAEQRAAEQAAQQAAQQQPPEGQG